ncbi:TatA/E family twin arginine-targeting protein translocase [Spirulina sp. CCNP1310]|uniref:TatA/E family twin arginine-targeting protein translocase n=1 Tax=Spirulina sp. CCNP1310 TaxID=3110249 RepID=UPI002B20D21D|nr:TatA/E family twin arginine-targeting protein translocase [Spirulina sp. CCNP1310]MEA5417776.1 TatA/E family twin arginine-targeting protein translocase [Spirulina sp. CCNP1310]
MNIFGVGLPEMVLILVVGLLIFGPKKLPEIGRSVGKAIRSFQEASNDFQNELKREAEKIEESVKMNAQLESKTTVAVESADAEGENTIAKPEQPASAPEG